jgi:hypothetical protein
MATGRVPTTANSPLTAKGDLFGYSTTQARVAVGNDGETLVADSSTSTGLRYQSNFAAGKNKVINGDFGIWQRGTSFSSINGIYTADRWMGATNKTVTVSQQTFTPGTAPVSGYEGTYFLRIAQSASGSYCAIQTRLEDVRLFAGQTVTLSFWAKADATVANKAGIVQIFGTGGSANVDNYSSSFNITTSWARYTYTIALGSISGKTIGTNSYLNIQPILTETALAHTIDIWGVQLEAGSVATAFQTATGTIQGELAACQRYYVRTLSNQLSSNYGLGLGNSTTQTYFQVNVPEMRVTPTVIDYSALEASDGSASVAFTNLTINSGNSTARVAFLIGAHSSGITQYRPYLLRNNASTSGYLGLGAEL